jgi:hypothetical protein
VRAARNAQPAGKTPRASSQHGELAGALEGNVCDPRFGRVRASGRSGGVHSACYADSRSEQQREARAGARTSRLGARPCRSTRTSR